jgi:hypothetical protein
MNDQKSGGPRPPDNVFQISLYDDEDGPGVFVKAHARRKTALVGEQRERAELVTVDWHFASGRGGLSHVSFDEIADDAIYDEAYPTLGEPVASFIARFLASKETVLVLQGPPGTGKTRLVRGILAAARCT